jgi:hypothetical protein
VSDFAQATADALAAVGSAMTLRRLGRPPIEVICMGTISGYTPLEIAGGIVQGDSKAILSNQEIEAAGWPGPPRKGDILISAGHSAVVQGCDTVTVGDVIIRHNLQIRGT